MEATYKLFISYSWSSKNHEEWVLNLAERLVSNGVDVEFDKWSLKEGQDKYHFMESMIKSKEIDKVLLILDKKYCDKANQRDGGVGTEAQIISPEIYANVEQEKFIPIIAEKDENGVPFMPTFLNGRKYIDLSANEIFEEGFDALLRNIYKRPEFIKPKLGKAPSYLFEETPMSFKTSNLLRSFEFRYNKNPNNINYLINEFLEFFYSDLSGFTINFTMRYPVGFGQEICDSIAAYTPLRNDFIEFFDNIIKKEILFDSNILIKFIEKLPVLTFPQDGRGSWSIYEFDNFRFYNHEIFLNLIALTLKYENFKLMDELLNSAYFFKESFQSKSEPESFGKLFNPINSIKPYYDQTFSLNHYSPMADLLVKRISAYISKDNLIDADCICCYLGLLKDINWFPLTYIYRERNKIEFFFRLVSQKHFEKVKSVFGVKSIEEFRELINNYHNNHPNQNPIRYNSITDSISSIKTIIDIEKVASIR